MEKTRLMMGNEMNIEFTCVSLCDVKYALTVTGPEPDEPPQGLPDRGTGLRQRRAG